MKIIEDVFELAVKNTLEKNVYGKIVSYVFFDLRSKIKQKRLNEFTEYLMCQFDLITKPNPSINDIQHQEVLSDILEQIFRKVISKEQKGKYVYYKNIIKTNIFNKIEYDINQIYIDTLDNISLLELAILIDYRNNIYKVPGEIIEGNSVNGGSPDIREEPALNHYVEIARVKNISEGESRYYIQHLVAIGLLLDISSNIYIFSGQQNVAKISEFGESFLKFIIDS